MTCCPLKKGEVNMDEPEVIEQPVDGTLDLHTFQPKEAASVVDEYLRVCREKGILEVKVIHGKGRGVLLRTVHALLEKHPLVLNFKLDTEGSGWGATIVHLKKNTKAEYRNRMKPMMRTPPLLKTRWMTSFCAIRNMKAGRQKGEMGLNPLQWGQQLG